MQDRFFQPFSLDSEYLHSVPLQDSTVATTFDQRSGADLRLYALPRFLYRHCIAFVIILFGIWVIQPTCTMGGSATLHAYPQHGASGKKQATSKRGKAKAKGDKKENRAPIAPPTRSIVPDSSSTLDLANGITHTRIVTEGGHIINLLTLDLKRGARLRTYKALDRYDGLEEVRQIFNRADSSLDDTVIAATNGSFWRASYNSPIGVTITDGEVIEMPGYKAWSSLIIYDDGSAEIDRVKLNGTLFWKQRRLPVAAVNRRLDEEDVVVYNHYYGDKVPRGSRKSDSAIIAEVMANRVTAEIGDQTEAEAIDTVEILRSYRAAKMREDREHPLLKIACTLLPPRRKRDPLARPSIGTTMQLVVTAVDTGSIEMPTNGFVISAGTAAGWPVMVQPGDTISLLYGLMPQPAKPIHDVITGTPRLVRDGKVEPEYAIEGSHAQRFVEGELSRTSVGISQHDDTLFIATVDSPDRAAGTTGMTLAQIASFIRSIGAYQAINLDGGGSATMVIGGETISRQGGRPFNRRVSNALVAVKMKSAEDRKKKR